MESRVFEREIDFKEAVELWKQNKLICFELDGVKYALNAPYSEDKRKDLILETNNAKWFEMVIKRECFKGDVLNENI